MTGKIIIIIECEKKLNIVRRRKNQNHLQHLFNINRIRRIKYKHLKEVNVKYLNTFVW